MIEIIWVGYIYQVSSIIIESHPQDLKHLFVLKIRNVYDEA
jgi:hypothetical protein